MSSPLVSVLVPTIGRTAFLPALRQCVASQTMKDFEVLILDNACAPEAREQLAAWSKSDPRIRHLPLDQRVPMFENFNRGLRAAAGTYVCVLTDDDIYDPRFLELATAMLEQDAAIVFAGGNIDFIDAKGRVTERRRPIKRRMVKDGKDYILDLLRKGRNDIIVGGVVIRRSMMDPRGFDPNLPPYYGDFVLMMRMAAGHRVGYLPEGLVQVRRHEEQESIRFDHAKGFVLRAKVLADFCNELRALYPGDVAFHRAAEHAHDQSNRVFTVWGWLTAPDNEAATRCLEVLGEAPFDRVLGAALRRAGRFGLDTRVRQRIVPFARRVGNAIR